MADLYYVPPEAVGKVWPKVKPWVAAAIKRSGSEAPDWTPEVVKAELERAMMQLWVMAVDGEYVACAVSEMIDDPSVGRIAALPIVGGTGFRHWRHCLETFEQYAMDCGAAVMQTQGREGWWRILQAHGWTEREGIQYRKRLH